MVTVTTQDGVAIFDKGWGDGQPIFHHGGRRAQRACETAGAQMAEGSHGC